jgi:superfamily II DNA/RNA helicase
MAKTRKDQAAILEKLGIEKLNKMQVESQEAIGSEQDVILHSPTGTGKTLAFLLPIIEKLDPAKEGIQVLIMVPSRELALQIESVIREMGSGFKANAIYGGRSGQKDKIDLQHPPAILVGTPGRIADRIRRENIVTTTIETLVLDEFDKSLEIGFEVDMKEILLDLNRVKSKILTSATKLDEIPDFVGLKSPITLDFSSEKPSKLNLKIVLSPSKDKRESLLDLLDHVGNKPGILFCNFKDSIQELSEFLEDRGIPHACFYGGMEQKDRERVLIQFRNGSYRLIIATDLAARGLDIPELSYIIHYQLPPRNEEFIHRNGRTARMNADGTAFVLLYDKEKGPDYLRALNLPSILSSELTNNREVQHQKWTTLFISGGRKDKISKGDIAGLFFKQGGLQKEELGTIELKLDCAFVAVDTNKVEELISLVNNSRLKKKKVRVSQI